MDLELERQSRMHELRTWFLEDTVPKCRKALFERFGMAPAQNWASQIVAFNEVIAEVVAERAKFGADNIPSPEDARRLASELRGQLLHVGPYQRGTLDRAADALEALATKEPTP